MLSCQTDLQNPEAQNPCGTPGAKLAAVCHPGSYPHCRRSWTWAQHHQPNKPASQTTKKYKQPSSNATKQPSNQPTEEWNMQVVSACLEEAGKVSSNHPAKLRISSWQVRKGCWTHLEGKHVEVNNCLSNNLFDKIFFAQTLPTLETRNKSVGRTLKNIYACAVGSLRNHTTNKRQN